MRASEFFYGYICLFEEGGDKIVVVIVVQVFYFAYSRSNEKFCAVDAGVVGYIGGGSVERHAASCRVAHGILFGVHGGLFMAFAHAGIVRSAGEKTVVSGGYNSVFMLSAADNYTSDIQSLASRARCNKYCRAYKIFVPGGAIFPFFDYLIEAVDLALIQMCHGFWILTNTHENSTAKKCIIVPRRTKKCHIACENFHFFFM